MPTETSTLSQSGTWDGDTNGTYDETQVLLLDPSGLVPVFKVSGFTTHLRDVTFDGATRTTGTMVTFDSATVTVDVTDWPAASLPATLLLHIRNEGAPSDWSATNVASAYAAQPTPTTGTPIELLANQLALGTLLEADRTTVTSAPSTLTFSPDLGVLRAVAERPDWDGTFAFQLNGIFPDNATTVTLTDDTFSLTLTSDLRTSTGLVVCGDPRTVSRADFCPICGILSLREHWVIDPDRRRFVCPECAESTDDIPRYRIPPQTPPVNEG